MKYSTRKPNLIFLNLTEIAAIEENDRNQYYAISYILDDGNRFLKIGRCQREGYDWVDV
ncbi:hypothetical protein D3C81_1242350 [compost metagenome]